MPVHPRSEPGHRHLDTVIYVAGMPAADPVQFRGSRLPRLLLISPDFPPAKGGVQTLAHRLACGLSAFDLRVVALDEPGAREFDAAGALSIRRVRAPARPAAAGNALLNAACLREAVRFRPDIVLSVHMVLAPAAALSRRLLGARTVQYFHAKEIGHRPRLAAFAANRSDLPIAVSRYTAQLLADCGVQRERLTLLSPGVDLPQDPSPLPAASPTFVTIARLQDRYKGHNVVMRAMRLVRERVPDARWVIVGDGPLRGELEQLAGDLGVADAVSFLGSVSDSERDSCLRRSKLLVMPSRLPDAGAGEGFGIVYLEAGAFGKPVVAGNVAGAVDAVLDGRTGLLVDPTDPAAVAEAIVSLLLDADLARRLGEAGAEHATALAWPLVAQRLQGIMLERLAPEFVR